MYAISLELAQLIITISTTVLADVWKIPLDRHSLSFNKLPLKGNNKFYRLIWKRLQNYI